MAANIDAIVRSVTAQGDLDRKVETLVLELADRIRSTSNDQNVQRLARELRSAVPAFVEAVAARADA